MAVAQIPPDVGTSGQFIDVIVITSSTKREIVTIGSAFTSSGLAVVTTGGGLMVSLSTADGNIIRIQGATTQVAPVTTVDGLLVEISNPAAIALTSGTVTLSSAPNFNIPIVSASSGLVQISGTPTIVSASSGLVQISGTPTINIVGTSGAVAPATSSGGLGVTILAGSGSGSTAVNLVGSSNGIGPVTTSGGLLVTIVSGGAGSTVVSLSSAIAISSGTITLSSVHSVTATAATNPWSSAPSFNVPIVSASSGVVQIQSQTSDATSLFGYVSSSSVNATLITGSPAGYYGYIAFNTTGTFRYVHFYQTSSVPGVGTTANWLHSILVPYSTAGGGGANLMKDTPMAYSTKGLGFTITDGPSSTSTGIVGNNDIVLTVGYKT